MEIVAIANHRGAVSQRRFDDRFYQLNARGIKHQNFGFIGNDFIAYRFDIQHGLLNFRQLRTAEVPVKTIADTQLLSVSTTTLRAVVLPAPSSPQ